jgi:hypothetical protein
MANTIRIKRSTGSAAPSTLQNAELAYSEGVAGGGTLYIGVGTGGAGGSATSVIAIGGPSVYASKSYVDSAVAAVDVSSQLANYLPLTGGTISSNLTVTGNLTVNGTTTTLNSTTLSVDDKNVVLADTASPSDSAADGGGITLKGTTDKTLNWVDSTDAWTSSEHVDLASGKAYYINGASVLSSSTLGSGVTASSLTSVGTISSGTWQGTTIAVGYGGLGLTSAVTGLLKGNGTSYSAATAGTDYLDANSDINGGSF